MIPSQFNSDVSIWPKLQQIYAVRENIGYFCVVFLMPVTRLDSSKVISHKNETILYSEVLRMNWDPGERSCSAIINKPGFK